MKSRRLTAIDPIKPERVIVAAGVLPEEEGWFRESVEELKELVKTASAEVIGEISQKIPHHGQPTYLGKGKMTELRDMVAAMKPDYVVFDYDLKPSQSRNIEEAINCRVLDRTEIILAIFARHARTNAAKTQVELAQLEYLAPRLLGRWSHLWRQTSGYSIGTRGPGEKQLEVDRRALRKRMGDLRRELEEVSAHRKRMVSARPKSFTVSLVGYTNSGKSTMLNALTGSDALVENKLFSTLDTKTRALKLNCGLTTYLSDTVGFIRKLPTHLVASFYATLEETRQAGFLLLIVDASHPACDKHIEAVEQVLRDIDCSDKKILKVFNKMDIVSEIDAAVLRSAHPEGCFVSAATGWNLDELRMRIESRILEDAVEVTVKIPLNRGKLLTDVLDSGFSRSVTYEQDYAVIDLLIPEDELGRVLRSGAQEVE